MKLKQFAAFILTLMLLTALFPLTVSAESLQKGDRSDDVYALQKALSYQNYYKGDCSGSFDSKTEAAVKAFQKAKKLKADGLAGKKTLAALGLSSDAKVQSTGAVNVSGDGLNMRNGASTSYKSLVLLKNGTKVSIIGTSGNWYKIRLTGGVEGYVLKAYIKTAANSSSTVKTGKANVSTKLTIRSGAGTSYSAKGYIKNGSAVTITGESGDWYKVKTSTGLEGYCKKSYIKLSTTGSASSQIKKPTQKMTRGMENNNVVLLQQRLKELGYFNNECTGYFGSITLTSVKAFQKANNLTADGIAGTKTLNVLFSDSAKPRKAAGSSSEPTDKTKQKIEDLIAYAKTFLGKKYVYGANGPNSFDCTGFTCYVFKHFGYTLPRSAYAQGYTDFATKIATKSDLKRGDLVFFNTINDSDKSDHAGIYLGNNQFIHASSGKSMSVVIGNLTTNYYVNRFSWGRRVITG